MLRRAWAGSPRPGGRARPPTGSTACWPASPASGTTRSGDTAGLDTPAKIHDGLRLDYPGTVFSPDDDAVTAIRFNTNTPQDFEVPRNSDFGGGGRYDGYDEPFTGNGFTKAPDGVVPEWQTRQAVEMQRGAEMWSIRKDGTQTLDAVFDGDKWVKVS